MKPSLNDLTPEQAEALKYFAEREGRFWKQKLNDMWCNGQDANQPNGGLLRQIRNQKGPSWLYKLKGL